MVGFSNGGGGKGQRNGRFDGRFIFFLAQVSEKDGGSEEGGGHVVLNERASLTTVC